MSIDGSGKRTSKTTSPERPKGGFLSLLRAVALIALVVGAMGSLGFMFRAGQHTHHLLLVLFTIWVLSPFVALLWANMVSKHWAVVNRVTLYCVTLVVTLASLVIYSELIVVRPQGSANAFLFVIVPPTSWLLIVIVVTIAGPISRRLSRRGDGS
jgi:hypothetical protein